jgi:hypothetical protein
MESSNTLMPITEKKKRGAQKGRVMTDAQREGLKKGFEALKAKREAIKKEKEQKSQMAITKADPITEQQEQLPTNNQQITEPVAIKPLDNPAPLVKPEIPEVPAVAAVPAVVKKTRNRVPTVSRDDFNNFKTEIMSHLKTTATASAPVSAPAPILTPTPAPVAPPPIVLSSNELLNKIFFNR